MKRKEDEGLEKEQEQNYLSDYEFKPYLSGKNPLVILLPITIISSFLSVLSYKFASRSDSPLLEFTLTIFIPISLYLVYITSLFLVDFIRYDIIKPIIDTVLSRYGTKTTGVISKSYRCDNDGDSCVCGTYHFRTSNRSEHQRNFSICFHRPSGTQWKLVTEGYSLGAKNSVIYLRYFPVINKMQFPI